MSHYTADTITISTRGILTMHASMRTRTSSLIGVVGLTSLLLAGCISKSSYNETETSDDTTTETVTEEETTEETDDSVVGYFDSELFGESLKSHRQVSCTLENGSVTTCHQLVFTANGAGDTEGEGTIGPFCPDDINVARSEAGLGLYDGATNPGFQSLIDAAQSMDADGYNVVNDDGTINFSSATVSTAGLLRYCISAELDSSLEVIYLIPVTPEARDDVYEVGADASVGVGVNGVPYKGKQPSVTVVDDAVAGSGSGNISALDLCGGQVDPSGFYHWHMIPQSVNTVLGSEEYDYTARYDMTCSNSTIDFDSPASFAGLAKDGYPIYSAYDKVDDENVSPDSVAELDECNGHTHATNEFSSDDSYHYHALENTAPNMPPCLKGSFVSNDVIVY
ncbi:YHYH protein [Leucothrix sargassi]|nr:YHYH protein [Leucothrix sargassi]